MTHDSKWLTLWVHSTGDWPRKETRLVFEGRTIILRPQTKPTNLKSLILELKGLSIKDGRTLMNRFLSILSWCKDYGYELADGWGSQVEPGRPEALEVSISGWDFPFYRNLEKDPKALLALALFREGMTVYSIPLKFLSFFKILNIFWDDKKVTRKGGAQINNLVEGINALLGKIKDKQALARIKAIQNAHSDVAKYLHESGRCAVAHAYRQPLVDPDDAADSFRLAEDMVVIKPMAEHKMEVDLKISRHIAG
jgi:hypothetical protein